MNQVAYFSMMSEGTGYAHSLQQQGMSVRHYPEMPGGTELSEDFVECAVGFAAQEDVSVHISARAYVLGEMAGKVMKVVPLAEIVLVDNVTINMMNRQFSWPPAGWAEQAAKNKARYEAELAAKQ